MSAEKSVVTGRETVVEKPKTKTELIENIEASPNIFGADDSTPLAQIGDSFLEALRVSTGNTIDFPFTRPHAEVDLDNLAREFKRTIERYFSDYIENTNITNTGNMLRVEIVLHLVDEAVLTDIEAPVSLAGSRYTTTPAEAFATPVPLESVVGRTSNTGVPDIQTAKGVIGRVPEAAIAQVRTPGLEADVANIDIAEVIQRLSSTTNNNRAREIAMQEYAQAVINGDKTGAERQRAQGEVIQYLTEGNRSTTNITVGLELLSDLGMYEANTILGYFNTEQVDQLPNANEWEGFQLVVVNSFINYYSREQTKNPFKVKEYEELKKRIAGNGDETVIVEEFQQDVASGEVDNETWRRISTFESIKDLRMQLKQLPEGSLLDGRTVETVDEAITYLLNSVHGSDIANTIAIRMNELPQADGFNHRVLHQAIEFWKKNGIKYSLTKEVEASHVKSAYKNDIPFLKRVTYGSM